MSVRRADENNRVCWSPLQTRKDTKRIYIAVHSVSRHGSSKPEQLECPVFNTFPIDAAYSREWSHGLVGLWTRRKIMYSKEFLENPVNHTIDLGFRGKNIVHPEQEVRSILFTPRENQDS